MDVLTTQPTRSSSLISVYVTDGAALQVFRGTNRRNYKFKLEELQSLLHSTRGFSRFGGKEPET